MTKWTQKEITDWAVSTFGEPDNVWDILHRASQELTEAEDIETAGYAIERDKWNELAEEIADVVIVLSQVMEHIGHDLDFEVARKMAINVNRTWITTGAGVGRHQ